MSEETAEAGLQPDPQATYPIVTERNFSEGTPVCSKCRRDLPPGAPFGWTMPELRETLDATVSLMVCVYCEAGFPARAVGFRWWSRAWRWLKTLHITISVDHDED